MLIATNFGLNFPRFNFYQKPSSLAFVLSFMVSFKWSIFGLRLFLTVWQFLYLKVAFPCLCGLIIPGHLGDQTWHVRTSGQVLQLLYLCLVMQTVTKPQMSKSVHSKVPVHSPSPRNPTFFKNSVYQFFFFWSMDWGGGGGGSFGLVCSVFYFQHYDSQ